MTPSIEPRPYRLRNQIQHYAWGTHDGEAYIARLLGLEPEPGTPYAELWLGAHPKAPSSALIDGQHAVPLDAWISDHPLAALGGPVAERFGGLPFLLKVLSAGESLSIQAHPTRDQARALHAADPEHYPDDNHKPEIAIALDELTALMGVKPLTELRATLKRYAEIRDFIGRPADALVTGSATADGKDQDGPGETAFKALIARAEGEPASLSEAVEALAGRLEAQPTRTESEALFLGLQSRYGDRDVGLFALFLFNLIHLGSGDAIFTEAGVPHAYLRGNIIECMANSDNVVRVGLTPKFRDAQTLMAIADARPRAPESVATEARTCGAASRATCYLTPAAEFELVRFDLSGGDTCVRPADVGPSIVLAMSGRIDLVWTSGQFALQRGESAFIPACAGEVRLHAAYTAQLFEARVPSSR
jgi:mannose-6-phosphate isomerase